MKVIHFDEAESYEPEAQWKRMSLCREKEVSVEHFTKPPGHISPRHEHPNAQVLVVIKGKLSIFDDKGFSQELNEGDAVFIPGGEPHVIMNPLDTPSVGIDIFVPGRELGFWIKNKQS